MKNSTTLLVFASIIILTLMGCSTGARTKALTSGDNTRRPSTKKTLRPVVTKQEIEKFLRELSEKQVPQRKALPPASLSAAKSNTTTVTAGSDKARSSDNYSESITEEMKVSADCTISQTNASVNPPK